jgi:pimeloyl-ACP methyl ester carboxylesterase
MYGYTVLLPWAAHPRLIMFVLTLAFIPPAIAGAGSARAQPDDGIGFEDCGNGWECGTLTVPLDYDDPTGETIEIAVSRLSADDSDERAGILMANPGGPGAGGISFARGWARLLDDDIRDRFDVVAFDPRGTGGSAPVDCDDHLVDLFGVDQSPDSPAEFDTLLQLHEDYATACREQYGDVLDHLGTRNVARDMDAIRAALGEQQVNYVGYSYGTRIGSVYAELFPERVRAFVLDGAVDNALTNSEAGLEQAAGFELAFRNFLESCERRGCSLADDGAPADAVAALLAKAEQEPIPAPGASRPARPGEVMLGIVLGLYDELTWSLLESALDGALDGDASRLVLLADTYLAVASTAVLNAVNCTDSPASLDPVDSYAEYLEALPAYEAAAPLFGPTVVVDSCQFWAAGADPVGVPDAAGAPPILVIGTTGDPATPYQWAEALAAQLDSGVLLRHEGEGHTVYGAGGSECVDDLVNGYLVDLAVPVSGTSCTGDDDPVVPAGVTATPPPNGSPAPEATAPLSTPRPPDTGSQGDRGVPAGLTVALVIAASSLLAIATVALVLWRRA